MNKSFYDIGEIIVDGIVAVVQAIFSLLIVCQLLYMLFGYGYYRRDIEDTLLAIAIIIGIILFDVYTFRLIVRRLKNIKDTLSAYIMSRWMMVPVIAMLILYSSISYELSPIQLMLAVIALGFQIPDFKFREKQAKIYLMKQIQLLQKRLER